MRTRVIRLSIAVIAAAVLTSLSTVAAAPNATVSPFDGETLFKGLFFGQGPVAALFPEIASGFPQDLPRVDDFVARVAARLRQHDPRFFDHLAAGVQNGDHIRIEATMDWASRAFLNALREEIGEFQAPMLHAQGIEGGLEINNHERGPGGGGPGGPGLDEGDKTFVAVDKAVVFHTALAVNTAVVLNTVVAYDSIAAYNVVVTWSPGGNPASDLQREMWVNLLSDRLSVK